MLNYIFWRFPVALLAGTNANKPHIHLKDTIIVLHNIPEPPMLANVLRNRVSLATLRMVWVRGDYEPDRNRTLKQLTIAEKSTYLFRGIEIFRHIIE